jgi:hypothetical protein
MVDVSSWYDPVSCGPLLYGRDVVDDFVGVSNGRNILVEHNLYQNNPRVLLVLTQVMHDSDTFSFACDAAMTALWKEASALNARNHRVLRWELVGLYVTAFTLAPAIFLIPWVWVLLPVVTVALVVAVETLRSKRSARLATTRGT